MWRPLDKRDEGGWAQLMQEARRHARRRRRRDESPLKEPPREGFFGRLFGLLRRR
jgi:hypothetical protein